MLVGGKKVRRGIWGPTSDGPVPQGLTWGEGGWRIEQQQGLAVQFPPRAERKQTLGWFIPKRGAFLSFQQGGTLPAQGLAQPDCSVACEDVIFWPIPGTLDSGGTRQTYGLVSWGSSSEVH